MAWYPTTRAITLGKTLQSIQGKFLRIVAGAYRATSTEALEIETFIEPLDLYAERIALLGITRQVQRGQGDKIKALGRTFAAKTQGKRGRRRQIPTYSFKKVIERQKQQDIYIPDALLTSRDLISTTWNRYKKSLDAYYAIRWRERWQKTEKGRTIARYRPYPTREAVQLYKDRTRVFSTILILLRTGKIGLRAFLFGMKVPGIEDPQCECQQGEETVQHYLLECTKWNQQRDILGAYRNRGLGDILGSREGS
jgi:hypothetical protein